MLKMPTIVTERCRVLVCFFFVTAMNHIHKHISFAEIYQKAHAYKESYSIQGRERIDKMKEKKHTKYEEEEKTTFIAVPNK